MREVRARAWAAPTRQRDANQLSAGFSPDHLEIVLVLAPVLELRSFCHVRAHGGGARACHEQDGDA